MICKLCKSAVYFQGRNKNKIKINSILSEKYTRDEKNYNVCIKFNNCQYDYDEMKKTFIFRRKKHSNSI